MSVFDWPFGAAIATGPHHHDVMTINRETIWLSSVVFLPTRRRQAFDAGELASEPPLRSSPYAVTGFDRSSSSCCPWRCRSRSPSRTRPFVFVCPAAGIYLRWYWGSVLNEPDFTYSFSFSILLGSRRQAEPWRSVPPTALGACANYPVPRTRTHPAFVLSAADLPISSPASPCGVLHRHRSQIH